MTTTDITPDTTIPDLTAIVDLHLHAYSEPNAAKRAELVVAAWDETGRLMDPPFEGTGHAAIVALTDTVLEHFPGHTFRRTTDVDSHHGVGRYGWELVGPDGTVAVAGIDVVDVAADGRLQRVVGFFG